MAGTFLALEGIDGSGKSSMVGAVRRHLEAKGAKAACVFDPGGTRVGGQIRKVLLDRRNAGMCPLTELLLYVASRAQLVHEEIRPLLDAGTVVVSDRFTLSTLAYQGVECDLREEELRRIVETGTAGVRPDHIILLDVPATMGLRRVGKDPDRMELKGVQYFESVRQRYLGYADGAPEGTVRVVDASRHLLEVTKEVLEIVDAVLF